MTSRAQQHRSVGAKHEAGSDEVMIGALPICCLRRQEVVDHVFHALARGRGGRIVTANLDFVQQATEDPAKADLYSRAELRVADGTPLLWLAQTLGRPLPDRVAGSDLVWLLAERAAREGRRLYLLGGDDGAAERAALRLRVHAPHLQIAGTSSPQISMPPTEQELSPIRQQLEAARPDLVFAAFGAPKQEYLAEALRADFPGIWWLGCGISLSFISGDIRRAPDWMQRTGLEWIHRLGQEPRRLVWRYLRRNLPFFFRLWLRALRTQRQPSRAA